MMDNNCVIYVRVSTDLQDYERQISELTTVANDFKLNIVENGIFEDKLSGFKNEDERIGLKSLISYCDKYHIKKILIWEISRLARKHINLLNLVEHFENKGINVYFKNQGFWLLDENGKKNSMVGMILSILGWYGEYETKLMSDRFKSQKILNESLGKYNGGKIPFGYKLDDRNFYIINEEKIEGLNVSEADIVKEVFELYDQGNVCSKICRLCRSKGYPKIVSNTHTLARLLRDTTYLGYKDSKYGKRLTPQLISESQFQSVRTLIDQNKTKADKGKKHIYLLRGLVKCSFCDSYYVGKQTDDGYICPQNSGSNKTNKNSSCDGGNISISNLDGIIWGRVKHWLRIWKTEGFDDNLLGFKENVLELNEKIKRYEELLPKIESQRNKINLIFKNDGCSPEEYQRDIRKNRKELEDCRYDISLLQAQIKLLERKNEEFKSLDNRLGEINAISDRNQMKSIIKTFIKDIYFYKADLFKTVILINYYKKDIPECIIYNSVSKQGNHFRLVKPQFFRFDKESKVFYAIKEPESVFKQAGTKILKENGVTEEIPEFIPATDFADLAEKYNLNHLKIEKLIYYPIPDETNSFILNFDDMMNLPDLDGYIETYKYDKMEYFKNINRERFTRKKNKPNLQ